jgi:hypothetical protein
MLGAAVGDMRELHNNPNHPLRRINEWMQEPETEDLDGKKRSELLKALSIWLKNGGDKKGAG